MKQSGDLMNSMTLMTSIHNSTKQYLTSTARRTILMLLLMMVGVGEMWGQSTYYQQDYESATTSGWTTGTSGRYTPVILEENGNHFLSVNQDQRYNNGATVTGTVLNNTAIAGISFKMSFDMRIVCSNDQESTSFKLRDAANSNDIFSLTEVSKNTDEWIINSNNSQKVTLANTNLGGSGHTITDIPWYTILIERINTTTYLTITDKTSNTVVFSRSQISTLSTSGGLGNMVFESSRYYSNFAIDNIVVTKLGWEVTEHTVALTDVNYDNKITSGMPTLYNPNNETVTYSYSGTALGTYDLTYPPRLKNTGDGTVTATFGGNSYSYTLHVSGSTVSGTYTASNNKYSFDQTGIITQRSFTEVDGVTMTINGGPTAIVVNTTEDNVTYKTLKVIDANGFSHPNRGDNNVIPSEGNLGGTFYKFEPTEDGHIYFEGHFKAANWVKDGVVVSTGTTKDFDVVAGSTYYLYNTNPNNTPLLHSYRFVPLSKGTLKFKNPGPTIIVDMSEGSYTNEAISGLGLPVTYSIVSGSSYATINSATGKVTFKKSELLNETFPLTITVAASTVAWNNYPAEIVNYTIQLAKTTWIFNDNDLWTTSGSDLSSPWGGRTNYAHHNGDGTYHYQLSKKLDNEALTIDGTTPLPETKGLLFSTDNTNNRLEIAPHGESPNYIAGVNTTISVPYVAVGQTVTVDWYATKGYATISMTDAGGNGTGDVRQGVISLTATTAGTVQIFTSGNNSYIRSIKVSSPVRATGTLTYPKLLLDSNPIETVNRTGYTITDEDTGDDIKDAYHGPGTFKSSNTDVVTVDASGNITAVGIGVAFITAVASPKNSTTHQTVTLTTMVEVVNNGVMSSATTHTRTISVNKLLYDVGENGKNANSGLDRIVPGFTLEFGGGDGAKCNNAERLTLRKKDNNEGSMTLTRREVEGKGAWIIKVKLTVTNLQNNPQVT